MRVVSIVLATGCAIVGAEPAAGAWPADPAVNLPIAEAAGDQVQPKIVATSTGGVYVGWFDALANGFDVRVQRLDSSGDLKLATGGVLVADRGFSSTQDYGLGVDAADHALLAFRDDRLGGVEITAARVAPDGTLPWGPDGVQLTSTTDFVAAPKIAGTSDGGIVVAWTQEATTRVQKLDADGVEQWGAGVTFTPDAGSYALSDLVPDGGDVIVSIVHQTGGFGSPRLLVAQKLDATGAPLFGAEPVAVFESGSLQFGNFPSLVSDEAGGAIFAWYDAATSALQCYVQHVLSDGTAAFGPGGVAVSTDATRVRVSPSAAHDPATGDTWVFWKEQTATQSQSGVWGQRLDAGGARLLGPSGVEVVPVGAEDVTLIRAALLALPPVPRGPGAGARGTDRPFVTWASAPSFGTARFHGARLDGTGTVDIGPFDVASTPSSKSRLDAAVNVESQVVLVWSDARSDDGDIFLQNVRGDGTLGSGSVAVPGGVAPLALGAPRPNPFRTGVRLPVVSSGGAAAAIEIYDVTGRRVRRLAVPPGARETSWDGRDGAGRRLAPGRYFVRPAAGGQSLSIVRLP